MKFRDITIGLLLVALLVLGLVVGFRGIWMKETFDVVCGSFLVLVSNVIASIWVSFENTFHN